MKMSTLMMLVMVSGLAIVITLGGCEKKQEPTPPVQSQAAETIEQTTCPIMDGNKINKDIFVEYKGKKVYFCCPACVEQFNKDPEKYISKLPQFQK